MKRALTRYLAQLVLMVVVVSPLLVVFVLLALWRGEGRSVLGVRVFANPMIATERCDRAVGGRIGTVFSLEPLLLIKQSRLKLA